MSKLPEKIFAYLVVLGIFFTKLGGFSLHFGGIFLFFPFPPLPGDSELTHVCIQGFLVDRLRSSVVDNTGHPVY